MSEKQFDQPTSSAKPVSMGAPLKAKGVGAKRSAMVPITFKDNDSLFKSYMPFTKGGGLFIPTTTTYEMQEEIFMLVTLPEDTKPIPIPGTVVWSSPPNAGDGKKQGVGVEFKGKEGNALRTAIEALLGADVAKTAPTFTM